MLTLEQVSVEATHLRELLTSTVPSYATGRREIRVPTGTSPLIARFWETVGWCTHFDLELLCPDDEGRAAMEATLEEWRAHPDRGEFVHERIREQLPNRYRVVSLGDEHITITDESDDAADPPLCAIYGPSTDAEDAFVLPMGSRYLHEVSEAILGSVRLATGYRRSGITSLPEIEQVEVLSYLLPGSRRRGTVWFVPYTLEGNTPAAFEVRAPSRAAADAVLGVDGSARPP
jgi:hypothetical protein